MLTWEMGQSEWYNDEVGRGSKVCSEKRVWRENEASGIEKVGMKRTGGNELMSSDVNSGKQKRYKEGLILSCSSWDS